MSENGCILTGGLLGSGNAWWRRGMRSPHVHKWRLSTWRTDAGCVIDCRCGAMVRVLRTGRALRPEVLADGGRTFTRDDAQRVVMLAVSVLGSP